MMGIYKMSPNTKRKALLIVEEIGGVLQDNCYFVARGLLETLTKMNERHLKKERGKC